MKESYRIAAEMLCVPPDKLPTHIKNAIDDVECTINLAGGQLSSRQVIATIIYFTKSDEASQRQTTGR